MARKRRLSDLRHVKPTDQNAVSLVRNFVSTSEEEFRFELYVKQSERKFMLSICERAKKKGFVASQKQLDWAKRIVEKLNRALSKEVADHRIAKVPPSSNPKWVARKAAKDRVWEARKSFSVQLPKDIEIAQKLYELGLLSEEPNGLTAINQILDWHERSTSSAK